MVLLTGIVSDIPYPLLSEARVACYAGFFSNGVFSMEVDDELMRVLCGTFTVGELLAAKEVCKQISYYYFVGYHNTKLKPIKVKCNVMCDVISHIELGIKKVEEAMNNE